jgi:hypothetical protein
MGMRKNILGAMDKLILDPKILRLNAYRGRVTEPVNRLEANRVRARKHIAERRMMGYKTLTVSPVPAIALAYLKKQWGFTSYTEATDAAILHLAIQTRKGLAKLDLTV